MSRKGGRIARGRHYQGVPRTEALEELRRFCRSSAQLRAEIERRTPPAQLQPELLAHEQIDEDDPLQR